MRSSRKTPKKTSQRTPAFRFKVYITGGSVDDLGSWHWLSYTKRPEHWTAADLLAVVRKMARAGLKARKQKSTDDRTWVSFQGRNGGTTMKVSQSGAYVQLHGHSRNSIPSAAIAGVMSAALPQASADMQIPNVIRLDRDAFLTMQRRMLKSVEYVKASIEERIASMAGAR